MFLRFNELSGRAVPDCAFDAATVSATRSDASVAMSGGGDPFAAPGVSGGGAAWVSSDAPWEPAEVLAAEGPREGRLRGGATVTLRGRNFAPSEWLSCVFGDAAEPVGVPFASSYPPHPTLEACTAAPTVPRAATPPAIFVAPGGAAAAGVRVLATPVPGDSGAVTCVVPTAKDGLPRAVAVSVTNGPAGLRGATRSMAAFVYRESSIEVLPQDTVGVGAGAATRAAGAVDATLALSRAAATFPSAGAGGAELRAYTVSLWIRPLATMVAAADVFAFRSAAGSGATVTTVSVRYGGGAISYIDDAIGAVEAPTAAAPGEWHLVVLSVAGGGEGVLGVDAAGSGSFSATAADFTTAARPRGGGPGDALLFAPSHGYAPGASSYVGHLDEIRLYSTSLTPSQLVLLPTCQGLQCPLQGLVAHYNFDDVPTNTTGGTGGSALSALPKSPSSGPPAAVDGVAARWVLSEVYPKPFGHSKPSKPSKPSRTLDPIPYPTPYTLHPTPCTLHPTHTHHVQVC